MKSSEEKKAEKEKYMLGQRAADAIEKFAENWVFIFPFTGGRVLWMVINTLLSVRTFDPYSLKKLRQI